ncbi:hypothetical protein KKG41_04920 [Patescibacteria group bacterium]|nr:hypothetical protein [Patescibacteria group bacterium]MBU1891105.1 hypothetical protein [Patescibacteria group bacterium]
MYDKKEMFKATCSECGQSCEVPFKPTGDKPVLCSSCFGKQKDKFQGRSGGRNFSRSGDRQMHTAICDKCGQKAEVPFKPTGDKPIFCSECFKKEARPSDRRGGDRRGGRDGDSVGNKQLSEQMKSISIKLDKLIGMLDPDATKKETPTKDSVKKTEPKKPEAIKKSAKKVAKKTVKKVAKKKK